MGNFKNHGPLDGISGKVLNGAKHATLEACPFCGSDRLRLIPATEYHSGCGATREGLKAMEGWWAVCCEVLPVYSAGGVQTGVRGCGATGGYQDSQHRAVLAWNQRARAS